MFLVFGIEVCTRRFEIRTITLSVGVKVNGVLSRRKMVNMWSENDARPLLPNEYRAHGSTLGILERDPDFGCAGKREGDQNNRQCDHGKFGPFHKPPLSGHYRHFCAARARTHQRSDMPVHRVVEYTSKKFEILSGKVQSWR